MKDEQTLVCQFNKAHNNFYSYTMNFENYKTEIICPAHGSFWQNIYKHKAGQGCPVCAKVEKYKSGEEFITRCNSIHNNRYDYSITEYTHSEAKVKIICPEHGIFEQKADNHLQGKGCLKCKNEQHSIIMKSSKNDFISKALKVHGNKYDYSLLEYGGALKKVKIICPEHGLFVQIANNHISGNGCPHCKKSAGELSVESYLNNHDIKFESQFKFLNCKNKYQLPFDFYLPEYNTCVEYDGKQHFEPIDFFGGESTFSYIKKNDGIKNKFCKDNNINLIRIKYCDDIECRLEEIWYERRTDIQNYKNKKGCLEKA